jgi:tetratricopeptide (TPR) repeat protein
MDGDFRLWKSITKALDLQATSHPDLKCRENAAFQLSICYELGFGCKRCTNQSMRWLEASKKTTKDLADNIATIRVGKASWGAPEIGLAQAPRASVESGYQTDGILKEGEDLHRQTIADLECVLDRNHPVLMQQKVKLAEILIFWEEFHESEAIILEMARFCREHISEDDTIISRVNSVLRQIYVRFNRWDELIELATKQLAMLRDRKHSTHFQFGPRYSNEVPLLDDLALGYFQLENYQETAEASLRQVEVTTQLYGEDSRATLNAMTVLAASYWYLLRVAESKQIIKRAVEIGEEILEKDDRQLLHMNMILVSMHTNKKERNESENRAIHNLEASERVLGDEHRITLGTIFQLAQIHSWKGQLRKALEYHEKCVSMHQKALGEHSDTAQAMVNLSCEYWRQVRWEEAEVMQARAVAVFAKSKGETHSKTIFHTAKLVRMKGVREYWRGVGRIIPHTVLMTVAWWLESAVALQQRVLHWLA